MTKERVHDEGGEKSQRPGKGSTAAAVVASLKLTAPNLLKDLKSLHLLIAQKLLHGTKPVVKTRSVDDIGVTNTFLKEIARHVPVVTTIAQLSKHVLNRCSKPHKSAFLGIPSVMSPHLLGHPDYVMAYDPSCTVHDLVQALEEYEENFWTRHASRPVNGEANTQRLLYYWLECLAVNPHVSPLSMKTSIASPVSLYDPLQMGRILGSRYAGKIVKRGALLLVGQSMSTLNLAWPLLDVVWVLKDKGVKSVEVVPVACGGSEAVSLVLRIATFTTIPSALDLARMRLSTDPSEQMLLSREIEEVSCVSPSVMTGWLRNALMRTSYPETATKGITLRGLRKLSDRIKLLCHQGMFNEDRIINGRLFRGIEGDYRKLTSTQLVYMWVKDKSVTSNRRLADCNHLVNPQDVGKPIYFISHAWLGTVSKLFDTIFSFLRSASEDTQVWIDFVAVNQHGETNASQNRDDVSAFEDVLQLCHSGTIVVVDVASGCNPASRAWCLYEWDHTLLYHGPDGLHMQGMTTAELDKVVKGIDVDKAGCQYPDDTKMILENIRKHHGSTSSFNAALKLQLMLNPLSYKVDLDQLSQRSLGTYWIFEPVTSWLEGEGQLVGQAQRILCVLDGAGTGKSTISAAIWKEVLKDHKDMLSAVHFLKHNDQRRLDPVRIIKSIAFQLASVIPELQSSLLELTPTQVESLESFERAFEVLLGPIISWPVTRKPIVILIDALDEGDPPEQLLPNFTGGVIAGANLPLRLLITCLITRLPPTIRFIVTSRHDAVCGGIRSVLERAATRSNSSPLIASSPSHGTSTGMPSIESNADKDDMPKVLFLETGDLRRDYSVVGANSRSASVVVDDAATMDQNNSTGKLIPDATAVSLGQGLGYQLKSVSKAKSAMTLPDGKQTALGEVKGLSHAISGADITTASSTAAFVTKSTAVVSKAAAPFALQSSVLLDSDVLQDRLKPGGDFVGAVPSGLKSKQASLTDETDIALEAHSEMKQAPDELGSQDLENDFSDDGHCSDQESKPDTPPRVLVFDTVVRECGINKQTALDLEVANAHDPLQAVYGAYKFIFDRNAPTDGCISLLQVLMAAQEPLPHSVLQQLGLCSHLVRLPGWGCLFYVADHRVYMLHKSLSDWLGSPSISGAHAVDLPAGHAILGVRLLKECMGSLCSNSENKSDADGSLLSVYTLNFMAYHLLHSSSATMPACLLLLDLALKSFEFIKAVFSLKGRGFLLVKLLGWAKDKLLDYSKQVYKWLRKDAHKINGRPEQVMATALNCPVESMVFRTAMDLKGICKTLRVLGGAAGVQSWTQVEVVMDGHNGAVNCVAFSIDGRQVGTVSSDSTAKIWDLASGECTVTLEGHSDAVNSLSFHPDGRSLVTASDDKTLKLWDMASGQDTRTYQGHLSCVNCVVFSSDGERFASGSTDFTAWLWDTKSGEVVREFRGHVDIVSAVALSVDGRRLVTGSWEKTAKVWDTESGEVVLELKGHMGTVLSAAFSSDGGRVATGCEDRNARVWDLSTCVKIREVRGHMGAVTSVSFSPSGQYLATGCHDKVVRVWEIQTGSLTWELKGHKDRVMSVTFSQDGLQLVSAGGEGSTLVWNVDSGTVPWSLKTRMCHVSSVLFSHTAAVAVTGCGDCTAKVWDTSTGIVVHDLKGHKGWVNCIALSPDSFKLATGSNDRTIRLWDMESGTMFLVLVGHEAEIMSVNFHPDGKSLVSGGVDKVVRVWNIFSGQITNELKLCSEEINSVQFSPDGSRLLVGSKESVVRICELSTGKVVLELFKPKDIVQKCVFSPDGISVATCGWGGYVRIWDSVTGVLRTELKVSHKSSVSCAVFSPQGLQLAAASDDKTVRIWDIKRGTLLHVLEAHSSVVRSLAYSHDGTLLLTGSLDETARIWEIGSLSAEAKMGGISRIAFSHDSKILATASQDRCVRLWRIKDGSRLSTIPVGEEMKDLEFSPEGTQLLLELVSGAKRALDVKLVAGESSSGFILTRLKYED
ncbi:hypothetical protein CEUSTIGMA_g5659.t1 [Chlamydomonas eustigma]|uniref:Nephrocystin 3-like N-terminal domain-containing protein n=1 Tax=Chlamydomonas eustigma TaxID=1157962 RepID=A0A250X550_9CHLO|nr:hypothetical protein CEUSTIGMA_g5659.t1 [Chlamydomonas eustigma]|eukprot:GAX78217.1 hypothetical protein CEUSTIGMA_g5659.t1 [Chlamydomonas eustigma]